MVESDALLVRPWEDDVDLIRIADEAASCRSRRSILDADTMCEVGFAVRPSAPSSWWGRFWRTDTLQVHELIDASHLLSIKRRRFGRGSSLVLDANDEPLGDVWEAKRRWRRGLDLRILDPWGLAVASSRTKGSSLHFQAADGSELAVVEEDRDGLRLTYADLLYGNPPARLLLLAAALLYLPMKQAE